MLLASRQVGKTSVATAEALRTALLQPPALVLVLSPSERQSAEFVRKVKALFGCLRRPERQARGPIPFYEKVLAEARADEDFGRLPGPERESALQLHFDNGSRVIGLPSSEATIRGYSAVSLLVIDEASRVKDDLYRAVRPVLAASRDGRVLALSTPFGKRGWFFEEWEAAAKGKAAWQTCRITAGQCPHISPDFLARERQALGARWYRQEYEASFEDSIDSVFAYEDVMAAVSGDVQPWGV